jgi:hypothetical protein
VTIYFMGGEMCCFNPSSVSSVESTGATHFDSAFARCAIRTGGTTGHYIENESLSIPDEFWMHIAAKRDSGSSLTTNMFRFYNGGTEVFRIETTTTTIQMKALIAAVMTNVGSAITWAGASAAVEHFDLYIDGNTGTGSVDLYSSGTKISSIAAGSVDLSSVTGIDKIRSEFGYFISQIVIADEPTLGWRLLTRYPNAAGATGDWTGTYTDVDEIIYSDADFINSATNAQVETFGQTGPTITGYTVRAVGVYARAKKGASGPENLQLALRVSGTDYFSGNKALSVGYSAYGHVWETNPATAAAWLSAAIDALQPGVKAIT